MNEKTFEPGKYLRNFRGRDYLEVKWRVVWLRSEHPDATVETELVKQSPPSSRGEPGIAIFRARVAIPGAGEASGWGSETSTDFRDYIEKAETKALGRALAALGYGTQFCEDFTFSEAERDGSTAANGDKPPATPEKRLASEPQIKAIYALARDVHALDQAGADEHARERFGRTAAELTRREASQFIDELKGTPKAA
ncbi:MAG TPA: hypothetical protein VFZ12_04595 [Dehalococcoidia bacterium]|nr:hypothetical protein [Dehalococcoidia bacterium]